MASRTSSSRTPRAAMLRSTISARRAAYGFSSVERFSLDDGDPMAMAPASRQFLSNSLRPPPVGPFDRNQPIEQAAESPAAYSAAFCCTAAGRNGANSSAVSVSFAIRSATPASRSARRLSRKGGAGGAVARLDQVAHRQVDFARRGLGGADDSVLRGRQESLRPWCVGPLPDF